MKRVLAAMVLAVVIVAVGGIGCVIVDDGPCHPRRGCGTVHVMHWCCSHSSWDTCCD